MKNLKSFLYCLFAFAAIFAVSHLMGATHANGAAFASIGAATNIDRATYQWLKGKYGEDAYIMSSYLRVQTKLVNDQGTYKFDVINGSASASDATRTEKTLAKNDDFCATSLGFFLFQHRTDSGYGKGTEQLQTFANTAMLSDTTNATAKHLHAFWQSQLNLKVGNITYLEKWDTDRHLVVPQTQADTITNSIGTSYQWANSAAVTTYGPYRNQRSSNDGYVNLIPTITLKGNTTPEIWLDVPQPGSQKVAPTTSNIDNYVCLIFRGFIIKMVNK